MNDLTGKMIYLHLGEENRGSEQDELELSDGRKIPVIWKDVLVEGTYPMTPTSKGAIEKPMHVIKSGESDPNTGTISMSDLMEAHADGAFKYVTIPTKHRDDLLDNTGYVPQPNGVRIIERDGKNVFQAALGFTEPDIKGKVERGTIPDVSGGIFFGHTNKSKKKKYACAMKHVALTPTPFMGNLSPFPPVFASDEDELNEDVLTADTEQAHFTFADGDELTASSSATAEIVWNENESMTWVRNQLEQKLNPKQNPDLPQPVESASYYVEDVSHKGVALVKEYYKGNSTTFIVPFERSETGVSPVPNIRWTEARAAMIAASDDETSTDFLTADAVKDELSTLLSDHLGDMGKTCVIKDVGLNNRVSIQDTSNGAEYLAAFSVIGDDVFLDPTSNWEATKAPVEKKEADRPAPAPARKVVALSDNPEDQVIAAKNKMREQFPELFAANSR